MPERLSDEMVARLDRLYGPVAPETPLYRYMPFWKFKDLVKRQALFFCRTDKFADPREVTFPDSYWLRAAGRVQDEEVWDYLAFRKLYNQYEKAFLLVSSWREEADFNLKGFEEYDCNRDGVAIGTTVGRLLDALGSKDDEVIVRRVVYEDFSALPASDFPVEILSNVIARQLLKRRQYSWEQEIRALIMDEAGLQRRKPSFAIGYHMPISLPKLIARTLVSGNAPKRFQRRVSRLLASVGLEERLVTKVDEESLAEMGPRSWSSLELLDQEGSNSFWRREPGQLFKEVSGRESSALPFTDAELEEALKIHGSTPRDYFLSKGRNKLVELFLDFRQHREIAQVHLSEGMLVAAFDHSTQSLEIAMAINAYSLIRETLRQMALIIEDERWAADYAANHSLRERDFQEVVNLVRELPGPLHPEKMRLFELIRRENERAHPTRKLWGLDEVY